MPQCANNMELSLRHRFARNPFIFDEEKGKEIVGTNPNYRSRTITAKKIDGIDQEKKGSKEMRISDNGEAITSTFMEHKLVESAQFIKIYTAYLGDWLLNLPKGAQRVLVVFLSALQESTPNQDLIFLSPAEAKQYDGKMASSTFHRGLIELMKHDLVAPAARGPNWYWINPKYVFNGDRIAFAKVVEKRNKNHDARQIDLFDGLP